MSRKVKDFIEISDHTSLDMLINTLVAIRDSLPADAEPEMKLRGDDVFGRRLSITYMRELSEEEQACEDRYAHAHASADAIEIERLRASLEDVPFKRQELRSAA
ncbi:hypothetical protein HMF7854_12955 [Sphingomonas ginkgonis]|uniref:Uncharacterized protein n=1 Tax=Sphingomonas ginkgonis TaxID=2315330 RepID=A0A3R9WTR5_9SPHN|nr:hypothetical protein [Sphingomonas ginkgonis]RST31642.1 hypothetical protein HMF7854_12955 [Sphingomonas ginkgonis]